MKQEKECWLKRERGGNKTREKALGEKKHKVRLSGQETGDQKSTQVIGRLYRRKEREREREERERREKRRERERERTRVRKCRE